MSRKRFTKLLVMATQGSVCGDSEWRACWKAELLSCRNQMPLMFVLDREVLGLRKTE